MAIKSHHRPAKPLGLAIAAILALAILGAGGWEAWRHRENLADLWDRLSLRPAQKTPVPPTATPSLPGAAGGLTWNLSVGQELEYDVNYASSGSLQLQTGSPGGKPTTQAFSTTIAGKLGFRVEASTEAAGREIWSIAMDLREPAGRLSFQNDELPLASLGEFSARFAMDRAGIVGWFRQSERSSTASANILRTLVFFWSGRVSPVASGRSGQEDVWIDQALSPFGNVTLKSTLAGTFPRAAEAFAAARLEASPLAFPDLRHAVIQTQIQSDTVSGNVSEVVSLEPRLLATLAAQVKVSENRGQATATSQTSVDMALLGVRRNTGAVAATADIPGWNPNALAPDQGDTTGAEQERARQRLGEKRAEEVLARIEEWEARARDETVTQSDLTDVYLQLKSLITLYPDDLGDLTEALIHAPPDSILMKLGVGALSATGSAASQEALLAVARARNEDTSLVTRLFPMMVLEGNPTLETEDYLSRMARGDSRAEVRNTASLALGILARKVGDDEPQRARGVLEFGQERLRQARSEPDVIHWLSVLGNAGADENPEVLAPYLRAEDEDVRAEAVYGQRFVKTREAERIIQDALQKDADPAVRRRAAQALQWRDPTAELAEWQIRHFERTDDEAVKIQLLRNLWGARTVHSPVEAFVTRVSETERSEQVRKYAQGLRAGRY